MSIEIANIFKPRNMLNICSEMVCYNNRSTNRVPYTGMQVFAYVDENGVDVIREIVALE